MVGTITTWNTSSPLQSAAVLMPWEHISTLEHFLAKQPPSFQRKVKMEYWEHSNH